MKIDNDMNARLRQVVRDILDMPENAVRPAHQNAPIYKGEEYITVQILSEVQEGTDNADLLPIAGETLFADEYLRGQRLTSANIQYYNGDAFGQLRKLAARLQSIMATDWLSDAGFGFVRTSVTDLTGLLPDEIWQTRASLRFDFYSIAEEHVRTPLIVQVPIATYTAHNTTETIVPVGGVDTHAGDAPPFFVLEAGTGEVVRLDEVKP